MSVPLCRLHSTQAYARFSGVESPPCLRLIYMVDLVRETGVVFTDQTIFATVVRAPGYFSPEILADIIGH